jgi:hypothetical protein
LDCGGKKIKTSDIAPSGAAILRLRAQRYCAFGRSDIALCGAQRYSASPSDIAAARQVQSIKEPSPSAWFFFNRLLE